MLRQEWRRLDRNQTTISAPFRAATTQPQPQPQPQPVVSDYGSRKSSAKAYLHQLCAAQHWKQPLFHCCREEGPGHDKLMKVVVSNDERREIVECLGNARSSKKAAAEDAAEGALWCLKHMGIS